MVSNFWEDKRVVVSGGSGFLGKHLVRLLTKKGCDPFIPKHRDYDLRRPDMLTEILRKTDIVFHLAANVGGIGYNQNHPYQLFYDNATMGINFIHSCIQMGVSKFVQVGTVCAYPKWTTPPFSEKAVWDGYPEETNAPYGLAKKMLLVQLQAARQEFGFNGVYVMPTNLYGPNDEFGVYRSHVIPALINKCFEAKAHDVGHIEVWGTGNATRDFLFVEDAAKGILKVAEEYDSPHPLNMGSGEETRISALVHFICRLTGYGGKIKWATSKPDGQPRRALDISEIKYAVGWKPQTTLLDGLKKTIEWYKKEYNA